MHYIIIVIVIVAILILQCKVFADTRKRLDTYGGIFPKAVGEEYTIGKNGLILDVETEESIQKEIDDLNRQIEAAELNKQIEVDELNRQIEIADLNRQIEVAQTIDDTTGYINQLIMRRDKLKDKKTIVSLKSKNNIWEKILSSINRYLEKNQGSVNDFHLIKDIVDRNCDAEEEAIQTQVPMPLYYGLMGTMAGIIVGVTYLWLSKGLQALLSTDPNAANTATNGIIALLGGVALAMICSIVGIILTTTGSSKLKDTKISVEERKHDFLSWMQAELLPKLNNDIANVLNKVTSNLTKFNKTFSDNAEKLHNALNEVNHATDGQAQLLSAIEKLKISRIASANIEVYDKLKGCTDEIGLISEQLQSCRAYLQEVRTLNEKLDASEQRTHAIEDMAIFFKEERGNIESMRSVLNQAIGGIQTSLRESVGSLKETSTKQITELVAHTTEQRQRLQSAIDEQDKVLGQKTAEINRLVANLGSVEKMVQTLEASTKKQSQAITTLSQDIRDLATQKASGTVTVKREKMPRLAKILIIMGGSIVSAYCLLNLIYWILQMVKLL